MSDIYVIYWSGTGNTEMMAGAVAEGIHAAGGHANVLDVASASADVLKDAKAFALGCPAMGSEQLEEGDMEPFVEEVEKFAAGKTIGLFGSYDWGDGRLDERVGIPHGSCRCNSRRRRRRDRQ